MPGRGLGDDGMHRGPHPLPVEAFQQVGQLGDEIGPFDEVAEHRRDAEDRAGVGAADLREAGALTVVTSWTQLAELVLQPAGVAR